MAVVVDASVAITEFLAREGSGLLDRSDLIAPPLLWSETCPGLRQMAWRGQIDDEEAGDALARLINGTIARAFPQGLYSTATEIARQLGWAKTYDAEYVALALIEECPLLTDDRWLQRRVGSLVEVIGPADL